MAIDPSCPPRKFFLLKFKSIVLRFLLAQKATGSVERDENYVPYTRSKLKLPEEKKATRADYAEIFEETPIYTLFRLFIMQAL